MSSREPLYPIPTALDLAHNDPEKNLALAEEAVKAGLARAGGVPPEAQLYILPELTLTGFVTKDPSAYVRTDPQVRRLFGIAKKYGAGLVAGFPEKNPDDPRRPFNTLVLVGPDGEPKGSYRKIHLFTWGKNAEAAAYTSGSSGSVFVYRGWKTALAVCYDVRFSSLFHEYAKLRADLLVLSACWIGGEHKTYQFRTLNSSYAILTQAYVAAVNRSGRDPFFEYDGAEYLFSPWGENLYEGRPVRLDEGELEDYRRKLQVRKSDRPSYPVETL